MTSHLNLIEAIAMLRPNLSIDCGAMLAIPLTVEVPAKALAKFT
ncbi:MAG: hypothetical protein AAF667_16170 [Pseudomonadota bacterium]